MPVKVTIRVVETMDPVNGVQFMARWTAKKMIEITGDVTSGTETMGYWTDKDGYTVGEKGIDLITYCDEKHVESLKLVALWLKGIGNQDCVFFVVEEVKAVNFV